MAKTFDIGPPAIPGGDQPSGPVGGIRGTGGAPGPPDGPGAAGGLRPDGPAPGPPPESPPGPWAARPGALLHVLEDHLNAGRFGAVIEIIEALPPESRRGYAVMMASAGARCAIGDHEGALADLDSIDPDDRLDPRWLLESGLNWFHLGRFQRALVCFLRIRETDPGALGDRLPPLLERCRLALDAARTSGPRRRIHYWALRLELAELPFIIEDADAVDDGLAPDPSSVQPSAADAYWDGALVPPFVAGLLERPSAGAVLRLAVEADSGDPRAGALLGRLERLGHPRSGFGWAAHLRPLLSAGWPDLARRVTWEPSECECLVSVDEDQEIFGRLLAAVSSIVRDMHRAEPAPFGAGPPRLPGAGRLRGGWAPRLRSALDGLAAFLGRGPSWEAVRREADRIRADLGLGPPPALQAAAALAGGGPGGGGPEDGAPEDGRPADAAPPPRGGAPGRVLERALADLLARHGVPPEVATARVGPAGLDLDVDWTPEPG